jgi:hypothetical protein
VSVVGVEVGLEGGGLEVVDEVQWEEKGWSDADSASVRTMKEG